MFGVVMLLQCNFIHRFEHFAAPKATDVIEFLDLFHNSTQYRSLIMGYYESEKAVCLCLVSITLSVSALRMSKTEVYGHNVIACMHKTGSSSAKSFNDW
jgi:hypothetical protein